MGSPKLKLYRLDQGYSQATDTDIQQQDGDELLPVIDKPTTLRSPDPETLQGVQPVTNGTAIRFDLAAGRAIFNLTPPGNPPTYWVPIGIAMTDVLIGPAGNLELRVLDDSNIPLPSTDWSVVYSGPTPMGITFSVTPPTTPKISCWQKASTGNNYALPFDLSYNGTNDSFNRIVVQMDGGTKYSLTASGASRDYIVVTTPGTACLVTYWYNATKTRYFAGAYPNWIVGQHNAGNGIWGGHLNLAPDVFVGKTNYPGDAEVLPGGQPGADYVLPKFVPPGDYQLDHRQGLVTFAADVDTTEVSEGEPKVVRANYARLADIRNVTGQVLDVVPATSNLRYKATSDLVFPGSIGKRWIGRNTAALPRTVYVNGVQTPQSIAVTPHEVLTIKTS
jgi:hypothetical protein